MANCTKSRRERLTVEVEPEVRTALAEWADEEGRPVGNLLRHVLTALVSNRQPERGAA